MGGGMGRGAGAPVCAVLLVRDERHGTAGNAKARLSSRAGERECLFVPCSFMEPRGAEAIETTPFGVVSKLRRLPPSHSAPRRAIFFCGRAVGGPRGMLLLCWTVSGHGIRRRGVGGLSVCARSQLLVGGGQCRGVVVFWPLVLSGRAGEVSACLRRQGNAPGWEGAVRLCGGGG